MKGKYNISNCLTRIFLVPQKKNKSINGYKGNRLHRESKIHVLSVDFEVM